MKTTRDIEITAILRAVRTKEDRELFLGIAEDLQGVFYRLQVGEFDKTETLAGRLPERLARPFLAAREVAQYRQNPGVFKKFLENLRSALDSMRILRLDLAFDPTDEAVEKIHAWVSREVGEGILLDIDIDKTILGGARIMFEGKYQEYTLEKMIESVLAREREEILRLIK